MKATSYHTRLVARQRELLTELQSKTNPPTTEREVEIQSELSKLTKEIGHAAQGWNPKLAPKSRRWIEDHGLEV